MRRAIERCPCCLRDTALMAVIPLLHTTICFYGSRSGPCIPIMLPKCSDMLCVRSCESRCRGSTAYFSGIKLHRCLHQRTSLVAVTTSQCLSAFGWHCWRKRMQHYCNWSSSWLCYDVINFVKNKITANNGKWNVVVCRSGGCGAFVSTLKVLSCQASDDIR